MSSSQLVGSIVSLWRYPVKSMMGEELNAAEVDKAGLLGDRAYALIDSSDGKIASAKNPRKWKLFDFRAALATAPAAGAEALAVRITLPDAVTLSITGPCPRCVMTTLPQGDLPHDAGVLRTAVQNNGGNVGVYASVLRGGKVRRGDSVRLE